MKEILINKLYLYIRENNPDLLLHLKDECNIKEYIFTKISTVDDLLKRLDNGQPSCIMEDVFMNMLTKDLRPSKYNYICTILEEEFEANYQELKKAGTLKFEAINLVANCHPVFDMLHFSEANANSKLLKYSIAGLIGKYLDNLTIVNENASRRAQLSTKNYG